MSELNTPMQNFNWATAKPTPTSVQVTRATSCGQANRMQVPSVIFIPCQIQTVDRWSPEGSLSDEALMTVNKKLLSCCRDEQEEFPEDSSVFATISESKSTRSGRSQEDDSTVEEPIRRTRTKVHRRYASQTSGKVSTPVTCRRSSMPPSLPRRKGSSAGLEL